MNEINVRIHASNILFKNNNVNINSNDIELFKSILSKSKLNAL